MTRSSTVGTCMLRILFYPDVIEYDCAYLDKIPHQSLLWSLMTRVLLPLIASLEVLTAHKNLLLGVALLLPRNVVLLSAPVKKLSHPPWCHSPRVMPQWFPHSWHALEPFHFIWNVFVLSFDVMFWRPFHGLIYIDNKLKFGEIEDDVMYESPLFFMKIHLW